MRNLRVVRLWLRSAPQQDKGEEYPADNQEEKQPAGGLLKDLRPDLAQIHLSSSRLLLALCAHHQDVPLVVRGEIVASALAVAGDREKCGRGGFWRHHAGRIGNRLRVDSILQPNGKILWLVVDRAVRAILQLNAEDERVFLFEAPHIADQQPELVIVVGRVRRGMEDAGECIRIVFLEKRIGFRLVH